MRTNNANRYCVVYYVAAGIEAVWPDVYSSREKARRAAKRHARMRGKPAKVCKLTTVCEVKP